MSSLLITSSRDILTPYTSEVFTISGTLAQTVLFLSCGAHLHSCFCLLLCGELNKCKTFDSTRDFVSGEAAMRRRERGKEKGVE